MMSTTEERLAYIRAEIERDLDDSEECIQKEYADNQLAIDSDNRIESSSARPEPPADSPFTLEINSMMDSRHRNNHIYQVNYDKPAEASTSVGGAVKNWFKQKIRRLIAPVIAPLVLDQNTFNASVTTSINLLSDNECRIAEFIQKQEEENRKLQKEMAELTREVARLRDENTAARLEIIRARKRLHREIKLLMDEVENTSKTP